jgi:hypothetical protein
MGDVGLLFEIYLFLHCTIELSFISVQLHKCILHFFIKKNVALNVTNKRSIT